ncbi:MAG: LacI family DNA-binding transcriptional regulator [Micrococcales bacterium]|nr:LacI family DNA-binding transcriptional regulator [Micrococcales bacterium]OJX69620.1 MAG: LacI family transcriptional regulator [Micrococcales bacterium 72-143]
MSPQERTHATIVDVANRAGVAISSASAALNDRPGVSPSTRDRIRKVAAELGYVPSIRGRSLSTKRAFSVGFVVERDFAVLEADPFFGAFIGGIEETLEPNGYALSLQIAGSAESSLDRQVKLADARRVDGVFLSEIRIDDPRIEALRTRGLPAVGINPDAGFPFPAVRQDSAVAIHELVQEMVDLGHRRIAHVMGRESYVHTEQRLAAWRDAMSSAKLPAKTVVEGGFTYEGGVRAADRLLSRKQRPTAVFCANDLMALGFMNRAAELGLSIPDDISVAGFDGISVGEYIRPRLTSIRTDPRALGRESARVLLELIDGEAPADVEIPPATVLSRDSLGPAPR